MIIDVAHTFSDGDSVRIFAKQRHGFIFGVEATLHYKSEGLDFKQFRIQTLEELCKLIGGAIMTDFGFPVGCPAVSQEDGVALMLIRRKQPGDSKRKLYESLSPELRRYIDDNIAFFGTISL